MTSKPENDNRIPVTLSLKRSVVRKLSDKTRSVKGSVSMVSRSRVAEAILERALR